jgi:hypothetical protein
MAKKSSSGSAEKSAEKAAEKAEKKIESAEKKVRSEPGSDSGSLPAATKAQLAKAVRWGEEPDEHDYPAAASFLSLICDPSEVRRLVTALKAAPIVHHQAKDLLRASELALLPADNFHVAGDLTKIARGEPLSPVLLMRGDFRRGVPLTIADGYHRVCASYHVNENVDIPCHLVDHKGPTAVPGFRLGAGVGEGAGSGSGAGSGAGSGSATGGATGSETPAGASGGPGTGGPGGPTA